MHSAPDKEIEEATPPAGTCRRRSLQCFYGKMLNIYITEGWSPVGRMQAGPKARSRAWPSKPTLGGSPSVGADGVFPKLRTDVFQPRRCHFSPGESIRFPPVRKIFPILNCEKKTLLAPRLWFAPISPRARHNAPNDIKTRKHFCTWVLVRQIAAPPALRTTHGPPPESRDRPVRMLQSRQWGVQDCRSKSTHMFRQGLIYCYSSPKS